MFATLMHLVHHTPTWYEAFCSLDGHNIVARILVSPNADVDKIQPLLDALIYSSSLRRILQHKTSLLDQPCTSDDIASATLADAQSECIIRNAPLFTHLLTDTRIWTKGNANANVHRKSNNCRRYTLAPMASDGLRDQRMCTRAQHVRAV